MNLQHTKINQFNFLVIIILAATLSSFGQTINYANVDSLKAKRKNSFIITPLIGYQQETRFAFGLAGIYIFKTNKQDTLLRASTVPAGILYTQNEQIIIGLGANVFMPKEKYNFKFESVFSKFPDKFWGIGNNTDEHNLEQYTFTQFYISPQVHRKVAKHIFVGLAWEFQTVYNIGYQQVNPLNGKSSSFLSDTVIGVHDRADYKVSGGDIYFTFDSRNHAYCPDKGMMLRLKLANFNRLVGSEFNFQVVELDFRKYIKTYKTHILAIQGLGVFNFGDVPFRSLAVLGGASIMRGYYSGRFKDKMFVGAQLEYRLPLFWRFGAVAFVSVGQVMESFGNFSMSYFHVAFGPGVRIALLPKEKLNLRFDLGITEKYSFQPYVTIAESF